MLETLNQTLIAAIGGIDYNVRQSVIMAFAILMTIACVAIIIVIMLQKGTNDNVGVISGTSDTFYGKHKKRDREGILKKITFGLFAFILVCAIICVVISQLK